MNPLFNGLTTHRHLTTGLTAVALAASVLLSPLPGVAQPQSDPCKGPFIQTQGESEMTVTPDSFTAQATIQSRQSSSTEATAKVNTIMNSLKSQIEELNIPSITLKTVRYNTYPVWKRDSSTKVREAIGYTHSQSLEIQVEGITEGKNLTQYANKILKTMSTIEGVEPGQLRWYLSSSAPYEAELLTQAIKKAKSRSKVMAQAANVRLTGICQMDYHPQVSYPEPMMMRAAGVAMDKAESAMPQVEAGQQTLKARVNMRHTIGDMGL